MNYKIHYDWKIIDKAALFASYDPQRIEGYCKQCQHYGQFWSCPPLPLTGEKFLEAYDKILLIGGKITLSEPPNGIDIESYCIETFHKARQAFSTSLLGLEHLTLNTTSLIAGNCYHCTTCSKAQGLPCRYPHLMRYSLESIGFDVNDILIKHFGYELHWIKDNILPEYLVSVGALATNQASINLLLEAAHEKIFNQESAQ